MVNGGFSVCKFNEKVFKKNFELYLHKGGYSGNILLLP